MISRDFNGDGRADLLWYNAFSGGLDVWLMNAAQISQSLLLPAVSPDSGWALIAAEDFSGDGHTDLLWANAYTGTVTARLLRGGQLVQDVDYATVPIVSGWSLAGSDDYNGDGRTDLFWFNALISETEVWLVDGQRLLSTASLRTLPPSSTWQPQIPR